jgi:hypothetical protein
MVSAAIVKYSGGMTNYKDWSRRGFKEGTTQEERDWASLKYAWDGSVVGWGPEAVKLAKKGTYDGELIR